MIYIIWYIEWIMNNEQWIGNDKAQPSVTRTRRWRGGVVWLETKSVHAWIYWLISNNSMSEESSFWGGVFNRKVLLMHAGFDFVYSKFFFYDFFFSALTYPLKLTFIHYRSVGRQATRTKYVRERHFGSSIVCRVVHQAWWKHKATKATSRQLIKHNETTAFWYNLPQLRYSIVRVWLV